LREEQPAEVRVRALGALGGEADAQKLKLYLTGNDIVPAREWTSFWRAAKGAAEADPRIDPTRAYEQFYRLSPGSAADAERAESEGVLLPSLPPRKSAKENLAALRKFLGQHPGARAAVAKRFGRYFEGILQSGEGAPADRAGAALHLLSWFPGRAAEFHATLRELWAAGLALSDLSGEDEQLALLEASLAAGAKDAALLSAADSRFASVRGRGEAARAQLGATERAHLERTVLDQAARYPQAALRLLLDWLQAGEPALDARRAFAAAIALLEDRPKPSASQKVLAWIAPGGALLGRLAATPCPDELRARIAALLRQWRSSDRLLFPALEAVEGAGLAAQAAAVRAARKHAAAKMFAQVGQAGETDVPLMTRATWERLRLEVERMERELRTTVPVAIQKARELGDLSENAEYEAAKHKQSMLNKQVAALQLRLARARFIEDAEFKDGVVGPGMEVVLESEREVVSYWILGEGEQHHGEHVISHKTPVARVLLGKGIGDEVAWGEGEACQRYRIVSVERKLPLAEGDGAP
jgi:transcription elongation factor GreA